MASLRTVLIVGSDLDDARAFISDADRKGRIPDELWGYGETLAGLPVALGEVFTGDAFDLVFITRAAAVAATIVQMSDALSRSTQGAWVEPYQATEQAVGA